MIYKFTHGKSRRNGVVLAERIDDDKVGLGWSKLRKGDRWNRDEALRIARERAQAGESFVTEEMLHVENVADSMHEAVVAMGSRAHTYYWPDHGKKVASDGKTYSFSWRRNRGTVYAPDRTPVIVCRARPGHADGVFVIYDVQAAPGYEHVRDELWRAMDSYLREVVGAVAILYGFEVAPQ